MRGNLTEALLVVERQLESYEDYVYAAYVGEARALIAELTAEVKRLQARQDPPEKPAGWRPTMTPAMKQAVLEDYERWIAHNEAEAARPLYGPATDSD